MAKLLAHVREQGLPETFSRTSQYRARKELCRRDIDGYGPLVVDKDLPTADGGTCKGSFQNPLAAFAYHCKHSEHFSAIATQAAAKHPPSVDNKWNLIIYQDGVDPSDGLAKKHSHKSTIFYWAFAENCLRALWHEEIWMTLCVSRYSFTTKLAGGASCLYQYILELFFGDVHNLIITGIRVEMHDGSRLGISGKASILLADVPALKECIDCKGHAGLFCCPCCVDANQQLGDTIPLHLVTDNAVSIANFSVGVFTKMKLSRLLKIRERNNKDHADFQAGRLVALPKMFTITIRCIEAGTGTLQIY